VAWTIVEAQVGRAVIEFSLSRAVCRFVWPFKDISGGTRMTQRCTFGGEQAWTGIDILAPAVGNIHGMLEGMVQGKAKKHLDVERISEIKQAARVFLTLHGGSGTDDHDLRQAIAAGISIIHINTELRVAWRRSMQQSLEKQPDEVVPYKILAAVVEAVKQVAGSRLQLFHAPREDRKKLPRVG